MNRLFTLLIFSSYFSTLVISSVCATPHRTLSLGDELLSTSKNGHPTQIADLLSKGANVNYTKKDETPLVNSLINLRHMSACLLFLNGADVEQRAGRPGKLPLYYALGTKNVSGLYLLLAAGANISRVQETFKDDPLFKSLPDKKGEIKAFKNLATLRVLSRQNDSLLNCLPQDVIGYTSQFLDADKIKALPLEVRSFILAKTKEKLSPATRNDHPTIPPQESLF